MGDYDRALTDHSKIIELNPQKSESYLERAQVYIVKKDYEKAVVDLSKAIELDPKCIMAYSWRSYLYQEMNDYDQSWADVGKILELGGKVDENFIKKLEEASGRKDDSGTQTPMKDSVVGDSGN